MFENSSRFEFATATRILFGAGTLREVAPFVAALGQNALVVAGRTADRSERLLDMLEAEDVKGTVFSVATEPTIDTVREGTIAACEGAVDVVIGLGGGSAIDAGKAIAAMLTNGGTPLDYLEIIGAGKRLTVPSAPFIAVPTTAGTGAEVTRNAVLGSPEHGVKVSLRSPLMLPTAAIVDPELTYTLPRSKTAYTGLDALTQVVEPFVSNAPNPITDSVCREGMARAARSLLRACEDGTDVLAREDMAVASLFGGLALANAKLGAVHGFAGPFGGLFPSPHGAVCAALLPHVVKVNIQALKARNPDSAVLSRYDEVARIVTEHDAAVADDGVAWMLELCRTLEVEPLATYGLTEAHFPELVEKAGRASSMQGNPIRLLPNELVEILERAA